MNSFFANRIGQQSGTLVLFGMRTMSFRKPSVETRRQFLSEQAKLTFTYSAVGATAQTPPAGFVVDHTRVKLGQGESVFRAAQSALQRWEHFRLGWAEAWPPDTPIQPDAVVAVMAHIAGIWWLNCCRIVYVVDEAGPMATFGYAYGTMPGHAECGEERFVIEWNRSDDSVWYDILAFSRPNYFLTRLGYPFVRLTQKRFARDSGAALLRAVRESGK